MSVNILLFNMTDNDDTIEFRQHIDGHKAFYALHELRNNIRAIKYLDDDVNLEDYIREKYYESLATNGINLDEYI